MRCVDNDLWEEFRESFEGWTLEHLEGAHRLALKELRTYLRAHGVWVRKQSGPISFARTLIEVILDEKPHEWTEEELQEAEEIRTTIEQDQTIDLNRCMTRDLSTQT